MYNQSTNYNNASCNFDCGTSFCAMNNVALTAVVAVCAFLFAICLNAIINVAVISVIILVCIINVIIIRDKRIWFKAVGTKA